MAGTAAAAAAKAAAGHGGGTWGKSAAFIAANWANWAFVAPPDDGLPELEVLVEEPCCREFEL